MSTYLFIGDFKRETQELGDLLVSFESIEDGKERYSHDWQACVWFGDRGVCQWLVGLNIGSLGAEETEALGGSHCEAKGGGCRDISTN